MKLKLAKTTKKNDTYFTVEIYDIPVNDANIKTAEKLIDKKFSEFMTKPLLSYRKQKQIKKRKQDNLENSFITNKQRKFLLNPKKCNLTASDLMGKDGKWAWIQINNFIKQKEKR